MNKIEENRKKLSENLKKSRIVKTQKDEPELHKELEAHFWFMEKSGWSKEEIDIATLMLIDRETIWKFLEKLQ